MKKSLVTVIILIGIVGCVSMNPMYQQSEIELQTIRTKDSLNISSEGRIAFNKAVALINDKKYGEAISYFTEVIKTDSEIAFAYYLRGTCKLFLKQTESALPDFDKSGDLGLRIGYGISKKIRNRMVLDQIIINN